MHMDPPCPQDKLRVLLTVLFHMVLTVRTKASSEATVRYVLFLRLPLVPRKQGRGVEDCLIPPNHRLLSVAEEHNGKSLADGTVQVHPNSDYRKVSLVSEI